MPSPVRKSPDFNAFTVYLHWHQGSKVFPACSHDIDWRFKFKAGKPKMVNSAKFSSISQGFVAMSQNQFQSLYVFNVVITSVTIETRICFGLLRDWPKKNSRHFVIQSTVKPTPKMISLHTISCAYTSQKFPHKVLTSKRILFWWQGEFNLSNGNKALKKVSAETRLSFPLSSIILCVFSYSSNIKHAVSS